MSTTTLHLKDLVSCLCNNQPVGDELWDKAGIVNREDRSLSFVVKRIQSLDSALTEVLRCLNSRQAVSDELWDQALVVLPAQRTQKFAQKSKKELATAVTLIVHCSRQNDADAPSSLSSVGADAVVRGNRKYKKGYARQKAEEDEESRLWE